MYYYGILEEIASSLILVLGDPVLDNGIGWLNTNCDKVFICSQLPASYSDATVNYTLGSMNFGAGNAFGTPAAASPSGRKVTSAPTTTGSITAGGTAAFWAAIDSSNSTLLAAGQLAAGVPVFAGMTFSLGPIAIHLPPS